MQREEKEREQEKNLCVRKTKRMAVRRWLQGSTAKPNKCASMELSGFGVDSGSAIAHRKGEIKEPHLGVPS